MIRKNDGENVIEIGDFLILKKNHVIKYFALSEMFKRKTQRTKQKLLELNEKFVFCHNSTKGKATFL